MGTEGGHEVGGGEEAVLVSIHDAESLLELLDGRVGEGLEDIGFLGHLGGGVFQVLKPTKLDDNVSLAGHSLSHSHCWC